VSWLIKNCQYCQTSEMEKYLNSLTPE
jgi:hypothetical protein